MNISIKEKINKASQSPGIYIFKTKKGEFLYIGKAANLRNRTRQYLRKKSYPPFMEHMINEAEKIEYKTTDSEIEALILESKLIKEKQPKYNIMLRDDKQYFYVVFTKDEFPKIFLTHRAVELGPFTDGTALKTTLRLLRHIFPYCTCKQLHNNFCLNHHIGKCLGYCCLKNPLPIQKKEALFAYRKNIKAIKKILNGKKNSVIKSLEKEMGRLGEKREFEKAISLRDKIKKIKQVFENAKIIQDSIYQSSLNNTGSLEKLKNIFELPKIPHRIEGYDISNIQGRNAAGSMIVFTEGKPDKNEYRKFKIMAKKTPDDTAMLKEVLTRRFNHPEWSYPDLIFIDGGIAQLNAAVRIIEGELPIISLAKGKQEIFSSTLKKSMPLKNLPNEIKNLILNIDTEAHRFAIGYYRKLHRKTALQKTVF
ncbi:MAG: hypothetical protein A3I22_00515 [Parcubacteria group bacterium RIFCSPLOWO2_02_FULL_40_12]|nr:MAG: hypothetical protein A3I22_00515 [Parcubacteria group bacterium RIFCSPLOWO2_02_FULL_40_12]